MTMSCVADAVATSTRRSATSHGETSGLQNARNDDRGNQQELREDEPAAAAAEQARQDRHVERVDQRRPQELHRVGRADQREQADRSEIDADFAHPDESVEPDSASGSPDEKPRNMTISTRGCR